MDIKARKKELEEQLAKIKEQVINAQKVVEQGRPAIIELNGRIDELALQLNPKEENKKDGNKSK